MRRNSRLSLALRAAAVLLATTALTGCISFGGPPTPSTDPGTDPGTPVETDDPGSTVPSDATLESFITSATSAAGDGTLVDGQASTGSGPDANVNDQATVINGGSLQLNVWSDDPFATVLIAVAPTNGSALPQHYEVPLDGAGPQATVTLTLAQSLPASSFDVVATVVDESGQAGQSDVIHLQVVEVGSGEVQVSVSWTGDSDVDLYVVEPDGETIYYGATTSSSGGELDLDSNAGCSIDGVNNENITWPTGDAPSGTYEVRINLWADCEIDLTSWVVTVQVMGQTRTWEGTLEAPGLGGAEDAGIVIATFDVP